MAKPIVHAGMPKAGLHRSKVCWNTHQHLSEKKICIFGGVKGIDGARCLTDFSKPPLHVCEKYGGYENLKHLCLLSRYSTQSVKVRNMRQLSCLQNTHQRCCIEMIFNRFINLAWNRPLYRVCQTSTLNFLFFTESTYSCRSMERTYLITLIGIFIRRRAAVEFQKDNPSMIELRNFAREDFVNNDLIEDFSSFLTNVVKHQIQLEKASNANDSLSWEATAEFYQFNKFIKGFPVNKTIVELREKVIADSI